LSDLYPGSAHVHSCGLASVDDVALWEYAKTSGFTIVSKDSDFQERSVLLGSPPKVIWVRAGNCSSEDIKNLLRSASTAVTRFIREDEESYLILGRQERNP
jgi:predicted nuclease of predicted toxin-antitoxin system